LRWSFDFMISTARERLAPWLFLFHGGANGLARPLSGPSHGAWLAFRAIESNRRACVVYFKGQRPSAPKAFGGFKRRSRWPSQGADVPGLAFHDKVFHPRRSRRRPSVWRSFNRRFDRFEPFPLISSSHQGPFLKPFSSNPLQHQPAPANPLLNKACDQTEAA
jgi:hypothetical protein